MDPNFQESLSGIPLLRQARKNRRSGPGPPASASRSGSTRPYRPEDQYTEVLPAVTAPGTPPRHAVADAASLRTGPQAAAHPAQPAAASPVGGSARHGAARSPQHTGGAAPAGLDALAGRWFGAYVDVPAR